MNRLMKCIVLYGDVDNDADLWIKWLRYASSTISVYSNNNIFISVQGDGFKDSKIHEYNDRYDSKIKSKLSNDKNIKTIEFYSLPKNYKQAAFDYDVYLSRVSGRRASFVQMTILDEIFKKLDLSLKDIQLSLSKHLDIESTLAFEMDALEFPSKFIMSKGKNCNLKTLKVIENKLLK